LFTILAKRGESYAYKTQAFRALLRGDTAGDIVCCYETANNPRGISTMAHAVDADDLVQSIPSVGR
jgi:hypothetical protein